MPTIACPNCGVTFKRDNGYLRRNEVRCCSMKCRSEYKASNKQVSRRFWSKVDRRGDDDCWTWLGPTNDTGYGILGFRGKQDRAHRVSYVLSCGEIPNGLHVLHSCDNPPCVNPKHLRLGTPADNAQDRAERGRYRNRGLPGEENPNAKLTQEQVDEMRRLRAAGYLQSTLAEMFGIHQTTVSIILSGKHWRP
jgi:hypothetical protein